MKKVIIFVGLKVIEISAIVFLPYFLGRLLSKWDWYYISMDFANMPYWVIGFVSFLVFFIGVTLTGLLCVAIYQNWQWAKKIANKQINSDPK